MADRRHDLGRWLVWTAFRWLERGRRPQWVGWRLAKLGQVLLRVA